MKIIFGSWQKKLVIALVAVLIILSFFFKNEKVFAFYEQWIFLPYQQLRALLFNWIPFSIGDIIYTILFIVLLISIIRLFFIIFNKKKNKIDVGKWLYRSFLSLSCIYLLYFYSWGANYTRPKVWQLPEDAHWDQAALSAFNDTLIKELNALPHIDTTISLAEVNTRVNAAYTSQIGHRVPDLKVKPSLFGSWIYYIGIQGYYNPFSGEAQFAKSLPVFMWGFVVAHEMAHQAGIAAEGEANFMAYVTCVKSNDVSLKYSAYFNLFLYANGELARKDSTLAIAKKEALNENIQLDIQTLKEKRLKYKSGFRGVALSVYNWMLQQQGQAKGLKSYSDISRLVYYWENANEPAIKLYK